MANTTHCPANFQYALPECQAFFAFGNASNHCCFTEDALIASNVSGGRQPGMREGFDHARGLPHSPIFFDNHPNPSLRGKTKGTEDIQVLRERGLWPDRGLRPGCFKVSSSAHKSDAKAGLLLPMSVAAILRWAVLAAVQLSAGTHLMA